MRKEDEFTILDKVRIWFEDEGMDWILVLDNADDPNHFKFPNRVDSISRFLPRKDQSKRGLFLITTTIKSVAECLKCTVIEVPRMDIEVATELFMSVYAAEINGSGGPETENEMLTPEDRHLLPQLLEFMNYLPIGIIPAATQLRFAEMSVKELIEDLKHPKERRAWLETCEVQDGNANILNMYYIQFERIGHLNYGREAHQILGVMAYLGGAGIPHTLLVQAKQRADWPNVKFNQALSAFIDSHLAEKHSHSEKEATYRLHGLVLFSMRQYVWQHEELRKVGRRLALEALEGALPLCFYVKTSWTSFLARFESLESAEQLVLGSDLFNPSELADCPAADKIIFAKVVMRLFPFMNKKILLVVELHRHQRIGRCTMEFRSRNGAELLLAAASIFERQACELDLARTQIMLALLPYVDPEDVEGRFNYLNIRGCNQDIKAPDLEKGLEAFEFILGQSSVTDFEKMAWAEYLLDALAKQKVDHWNIYEDLGHEEKFRFRERGDYYHIAQLEAERATKGAASGHTIAKEMVCPQLDQLRAFIEEGVTCLPVTPDDSQSHGHIRRLKMVCLLKLQVHYYMLNEEEADKISSMYSNLLQGIIWKQLAMIGELQFAYWTDWQPVPDTDCIVHWPWRVMMEQSVMVLYESLMYQRSTFSHLHMDESWLSSWNGSLSVVAAIPAEYDKMAYRYEKESVLKMLLRFLRTWIPQMLLELKHSSERFIKSSYLYREGIWSVLYFKRPLAQFYKALMDGDRGFADQIVMDTDSLWAECLTADIERRCKNFNMAGFLYHYVAAVVPEPIASADVGDRWNARYLRTNCATKLAKVYHGVGLYESAYGCYYASAHDHILDMQFFLNSEYTNEALFSKSAGTGFASDKARKARLHHYVIKLLTKAGNLFASEANSQSTSRKLAALVFYQAAFEIQQRILCRDDDDFYTIAPGNPIDYEFPFSLTGSTDQEINVLLCAFRTVESEAKLWRHDDCFDCKLSEVRLAETVGNLRMQLGDYDTGFQFLSLCYHLTDHNLIDYSLHRDDHKFTTRARILARIGHFKLRTKAETRARRFLCLIYGHESLQSALIDVENALLYGTDATSHFDLAEAIRAEQLMYEMTEGVDWKLEAPFGGSFISFKENTLPRHSDHDHLKFEENSNTVVALYTLFDAHCYRDAGLDAVALSKYLEAYDHIVMTFTEEMTESDSSHSKDCEERGVVRFLGNLMNETERGENSELDEHAPKAEQEWQAFFLAVYKKYRELRLRENPKPKWDFAHVTKSDTNNRPANDLRIFQVIIAIRCMNGIIHSATRNARSWNHDVQVPWPKMQPFHKVNSFGYSSSITATALLMTYHGLLNSLGVDVAPQFEVTANIGIQHVSCARVLIGAGWGLPLEEAYKNMSLLSRHCLRHSSIHLKISNRFVINALATK
ncbi:hypothetical protein BJ508DRAFT_14210 [Ascobolus immersus RN42]|uniref:Uncharacterized protein n=1 Tax=Ascobolus immersus RN42 TaxID=1160509 RepID=A0A3N4IIE7_ASCIM|nr:hypothetical protein BJ508DRAFT_14210 [Ascobolus immersus RN42]